MAYRNHRGKIALWCAIFMGLSISVSCQTQEVALLVNSKIVLAPPIIQIDSLLFKESASATLQLRQEGATLRYTLDGSDVSTSAALYQSPIVLKETVELKAKAFHSDFQASETAAITTRKVKSDLGAAEIQIQPNPSKTYSASGRKTLIDGQKGSTNFRRGNFWLGFQESEILVSLSLEQPTKINKVVVSVLNDQDSWIFLPQKLTVVSNGISVGSKVLENCAEKTSKQTKFVEVDIAPGAYSTLLLTLSAMEGIPEWHAGKGTPPWTFIDEILIE
ncbi:MAG: chitobiase/beta-hexosaminidase C-terminal domain-containing protein [Bacteroidota bacterium]